MGTIARNEFFKSINAPRDLAFKQFLLSHTTFEEIEKNEELRKIKDELDEYKLKSKEDKDEDFEDFEDFEDELDDFEAENEFKMYKCYLKRYITGNKAILKNGCKIEIDNSKFDIKSIIYQYSQLADYDFKCNEMLKYYLNALSEIIDATRAEARLSTEGVTDYDNSNEFKNRIKTDNFDEINELLSNIENYLSDAIDESADELLTDYLNRVKNINDNILLIYENILKTKSLF